MERFTPPHEGIFDCTLTIYKDGVATVVDQWQETRPIIFPPPPTFWQRLVAAYRVFKE